MQIFTMQSNHMHSISFDSQGAKCAGWFFPAAMPGQRPCIVLAHGLAGIKEMRLAAYAERFAAAGYHALVFDYRHFGESEGQPRQLLDIGRQQQDWRAAIAHARGLANVDAERIVLWGTSFSGGHVMAIAAEYAWLAAIIAQVPHARGPTSALAGGLLHGARLTFHALLDLARATAGLSPHYINACGQPGELALMTAPGEADGYLRLLAGGQQFDQRLAARLIFAALRYSPGKQMGRLRIPTLVQVAMDDLTTPAAAAIRACQDAPKVTLKQYPGGHFQPYVAPLFETIIGDQLAFLQAVLAESAPV